MAAGDKSIGYEGLANLAHSVRRSTALYVAMQMTPEDGTVEEMLTIADRLATWIGGKAAEAEGRATPPTRLGKAMGED